jgi:molybdopterin-guanine dinucleotide biosynthesis protein B
VSATGSKVKGPPGNVISLVGPANAGKTLIICRLLAWFKERGLRVAVLKHSHHTPPAASPEAAAGRQAGLDAWAVAVPGVLQINRFLPGAPDLAELLSFLSPQVDIVLVEGYKTSYLPKILLAGPGLEEVIPPPGNVVARLSSQVNAGSVPSFHPDDVENLGRFVMARCGLSFSGNEAARGLGA